MTQANFGTGEYINSSIYNSYSTEGDLYYMSKRIEYNVDNLRSFNYFVFY